MMRHTVADLATGRPRLVYGVIIMLVLVFAVLITRIHIDTDPENMLPADQPQRAFHNEVENRFTLHDAIVVGIVNERHPDGIYNIESLSALHALSGQILDLDGVIAPDLMSLAESDNISQEGPGTIRFEWMMKDAPQSEAQALEIRRKVERLPLLMNTLVSGDGRAAAIYVPIRSKDLSYPLSKRIRALADDLGAGDQYHITGLPVAEDTFGHDMFLQMGISAPLAGLMIFLLMLYFFRSPWFVLAPMLVAMATVIVTMGMLIGTGFTVHIMSSMIPIFLMPIAVVDSVHILSEFADGWRAEKDAGKLIRKVVAHLFKPMLLTSLTSAAGFLSLLLTPIPPVQVFGAFVAFGIILAFVLTIVLVPAYVVRMSPAALARLASGRRSPATDTLLSRGLRRAGRFATGNGRAISGVAVLLVGLAIAGIYQIRINDNPVRWFKADHPIRIADRVLNTHFAGTYDAFLVLSYNNAEALPEFAGKARDLLQYLSADLADVLVSALDAGTDDAAAYFANLIDTAADALFDAEEDGSVAALQELIRIAEEAQSEAKYFQRPDILRRIDDLQVVLDKSGLVGKSNALPDVVKLVNRELHEGTDEGYRIPDTVPGVAQTLLQFQSSHRPQDLWHMVTPDFTSTAIWLQLRSGDNQDMTRVMSLVDSYIEGEPWPEHVEMRWAGKTFINVIWQDAMVSGMLKSLMGAFAVVLLMMALLFRSARLGLLAMIPLSVTIIGVYGIIGWIGKDYDMPIAVLSALSLGLSVDFAIHFIERSRALLQQSGSFAAAMDGMFEEPGRAIARNAVVIALGFTPLLFAPLVPYITVGVFMASIMALSGVSTLVLLPAVMSWAGPWLFPDARRAGAFGAAVTVESAA